MIGKKGRSHELGSEMSVATTTRTAPTAVAPPAEGASREHDEVEYPERHWVAQSVWHGDAVRLATTALRNHFRDREDVLVAMELAVYYERGDETRWLQPDVQVVFGVRRGGNRSSFRIWQEGKAPDFVLEVASPSTAENDARHKAREYARLGVREYWRLDPEGSLMGTELEGYAVTGGRYAPLERVERAGRGGLLRSRVLGLDLRTQRHDGATVVVFADQRTGEEFNGSLEESERRRRIAEQRASAAREEAERQRRIAEERASAAREEAEQRASAAEDRARSAEERMRAMEERLQRLTGPARLPERDS